MLINKVFNLSQLQTGDCLVKMSIEGLKKVKAIVNKQSQSQFLLAETDTSESS